MIRWVQMLGVLLSVHWSSSFASELTSVVYTEEGPVRGEIFRTVWHDQECASFKGIPYANPPIGNGRFRPPVAVKPWSETLEATKEGSVCPQFDFVTSELTGNEDCLYLNVYTPHTAFDEKRQKYLKPVMVWIYGGSFTSGYKNQDLYGPDFFLEEDVLVVTLNYRLGALGFLALDHPKALGNAGLKDQRLALRWVQKNIKHFGGDPKNVTLFGQSAGGVAVDFHTLCENCEDLYQRAIIMSASTLAFWGFYTPLMAKERAFRLGHKLGHTTFDAESLLRFLQKADAYDLVNATKDMELVDPVFKPTLENPSLAPMEDIFMTECSIRKLRSGNFKKQPLMMGRMKLEALYFAQPVQNLLNWEDHILGSIGGFGNTTVGRFAGRNVLSYLTDEIDSQSLDAVYKLIEIISDFAFVAPIDESQQLKAKYMGHPIYYYEISYETTYALHTSLFNNTLKGAAHGDDFGFIFHNRIVDVPTDPMDPFNVYRKKIVHLWANFAKFSNPTPNGVQDPLLKTRWPDSRPLGKQLDIGTDLKVVDRQVNLKTHLFELIVGASAPITTGCGSRVLNLLRKNLYR